jgi:type III restriction enzyme
MVFDYIAGWEKTLKNGSTVPVPGKLPLFSNVEGDRWSARPNTILVDSSQLESGEGMSAEFKHIAAGEIQEFKTIIAALWTRPEIDRRTYCRGDTGKPDARASGSNVSPVPC